jgi:DNA polymerase-3 subunit delta'
MATALQQINEQPEAVAFLQRVVEGKLTTPLMLVGPEGVGKRTSVLATASDVFPVKQHKLLASGQHPDFLYCCRSGDKDIGIEPIRELIEQANSMPVMASVRFLVVDGAEHLTVAAANAILKTLEEPPSKVRFFMLANHSGRVLPTIRSRCGIVRYRPLSLALVRSFVDPLTDDSTKALVVSKLAEGSVGRALQYLGGGRLALRDQMFNLLKTGLSGDISSGFSAVDEVKELTLGLHFLEHLLHDLLVLPHSRELVLNVDLAQELAGVRDRLKADTMDRLLLGFQRLCKAQRTNINLGYHLKAYLATSFS